MKKPFYLGMILLTATSTAFAQKSGTTSGSTSGGGSSNTRSGTTSTGSSGSGSSIGRTGSTGGSNYGGSGSSGSTSGGSTSGWGSNSGRTGSTGGSLIGGSGSSGSSSGSGGSSGGSKNYNNAGSSGYVQGNSGSSTTGSTTGGWGRPAAPAPVEPPRVNTIPSGNTTRTLPPMPTAPPPPPAAPAAVQKPIFPQGPTGVPVMPSRPLAPAPLPPPPATNPGVAGSNRLPPAPAPLPPPVPPAPPTQPSRMQIAPGGSSVIPQTGRNPFFPQPKVGVDAVTGAVGAAAAAASSPSTTSSKPAQPTQPPTATTTSPAIPPAPLPPGVKPAQPPAPGQATGAIAPAPAPAGQQPPAATGGMKFPSVGTLGQQGQVLQQTPPSQPAAAAAAAANEKAKAALGLPGTQAASAPGANGQQATQGQPGQPAKPVQFNSFGTAGQAATGTAGAVTPTVKDQTKAALGLPGAQTGAATAAAGQNGTQKPAIPAPGTAANTAAPQPGKTTGPVPMFKIPGQPMPKTGAIPSVGVPIPGYGNVGTKTATGATYKEVTQPINGKVLINDKVSGKQVTIDLKTGTGEMVSGSGKVKNNFQMKPGGYIQNNYTFKGWGDKLITKQYNTRRTEVDYGGQKYTRERYVRREVPKVISRDDDDYYYWYWLTHRNGHYNQNGGYTGGYSGGSSGFDNGSYSGGGGFPQIEAPPKEPIGFEISWDDYFEILPEDMKDAKMTYKKPEDAVSAFVTLDIIKDNSEVPAGWKKLVKAITFGIWDPTEGTYVYKFDSGARAPLTRQISMMAAKLTSTPELGLEDIIDESSGELKLDDRGNPPTYFFVVDPGNAAKVYDADSHETCTLEVATVLRPVEALISGNVRAMKMRVLNNGRNQESCKASQTVLVQQSDLEEMNNDLANRVDTAIHKIPAMAKPVFR